MTERLNSLRAVDAASIIHPQSNLRQMAEIGPMIMTRGEGVYVYDDAGNEYLESVAGLWCASLGFSVSRLADAAHKAMNGLSSYHIYRDTSNEAAIELAAKLLEIAPVPMSKVYFQCSGSEANDTAAKLAWYYWHAKGQPQRRKIIGRRNAYHGSTGVAASISGKADMHQESGIPLPGFIHTEYPNYYRCAEPGESEQSYSDRMAAALEALIQEEGPETIAAFFAEPVMGAGGAVLPPAGYFEKIEAVLKRHDILFVADEVICGFGRTGNMWGTETYALQPDMISSAKALSAGTQPISALMVNERVFEALMAGTEKVGHFAHGHTYAGHPVTAAVALETLKIYEEMDLIGHVKSVEPVFLERLGALRAHPLVGDFSGVGLIGAIEIVADKQTRAPHPASANVMHRLGEHAKRRGLILRLIANRVAFSPPLIITRPELEIMAERLAGALDDTLAELHA